MIINPFKRKKIKNLLQEVNKTLNKLRWQRELYDMYHYTEYETRKELDETHAALIEFRLQLLKLLRG